MSELGWPRLHLRLTDSTNLRLRELAEAGAPHGTLVTATEQLAGRGRQGRSWSAPAGTALLCSLLLHEPPPLLSLIAGVALAEVCGDGALVKWPNDVLVGGRKVAGILVEARPQAGWAVLGIGLNVAVDVAALPGELRDRAGSLGLGTDAIEPTLLQLLRQLQHRLTQPLAETLALLRARDALLGQTIAWAEGKGRAAGIADDGRLLVQTASGQLALDAGEVHLGWR
jgi:BirA family transcriptional regulator, biotin operon repressor / biotin---[acetyl-CoA-carboxylase] ligase